jgi:hypothetical protein
LGLSIILSEFFIFVPVVVRLTIPPEFMYIIAVLATYEHPFVQQKLGGLRISLTSGLE